MFRKKIALALVFSFLLSIPAFADQNAPVPPTTVSPINPPIVSENWAESTGTITAIQKDQITISINIYLFIVTRIDLIESILVTH